MLIKFCEPTCYNRCAYSTDELYFCAVALWSQQISTCLFISLSNEVLTDFWKLQRVPFIHMLSLRNSGFRGKYGASQGANVLIRFIQYVVLISQKWHSSNRKEDMHGSLTLVVLNKIFTLLCVWVKKGVYFLFIFHILLYLLTVSVVLLKPCDYSVPTVYWWSGQTATNSLWPGCQHWDLIGSGPNDGIHTRDCKLLSDLDTAKTRYHNILETKGLK